MMAIEIIGPRYHLNEAFSANLKTGEVVVFPNTPEREHFWNVEVGRRLDELFDRLKVPQHLRGME